MAFLLITFCEIINLKKRNFRLVMVLVSMCDYVLHNIADQFLTRLTSNQLT